ncbi:flagellar protein FlaG [Crenobacter cavernae]|uniref:Flagellar protein n=1 Tax=Crenobacter cavernae TaxID=2290923 RepID=A0A345Y609_9NEIS|nr:flagellar protein FlaG [Crenobacter cavernae]AXK39361.1 flagellar protein [Crenobacter cavernae]
MSSLTPLSPAGGLPLPTADVSGRSLPLPTPRSSAPTVPVSAQAVQALGNAEAGGGARAGTDRQALTEAVEKVGKAVSAYTSELQFSIDDDLGVTVVKVIDKQNDEVIRQIPSEDMLKLAKGLDKLLGVLIEQKA